jgi:hypothetical protein
MIKNTTYLGDAVYAEFDGYGISLRTQHHRPELCTNEIYLEPEVLQALNNFLASLQKVNDK